MEDFMEIITKEELDKINGKIINIKIQFQNAMLIKDYKTANKYVDELGKLTKRVKKYEKYLKKKGDINET